MAYKPLDSHVQVGGEEDEPSNIDARFGEDEEKVEFLPGPASPISLSSDLPGKRVFKAPHPAGGVPLEVNRLSIWPKVIRYGLGVGAFVLLFGFLTAAIVLVALSPPCNSNGLEWWKTTVIYQCYPRSFKDTTGDGSGDLEGVLEKLGYLHDLGINAVWLNPIFKSPQKDNGYDVSNYTDVDPLYGSMDDLRKLLEDVHSKGMHLILDFVPNHTSDEHPWFKESRSSSTNPKRDWYVWANAGADGGPPNNWYSLFGGPAWSWDNITNQYYLHQFSSFQPDLNYHNPDVKKAMEDVIKFWFDFGVDGFRIDAVIYLLEDSRLRSEPPNPKFNESVDCTGHSNNSECYKSLLHIHTQDQPGIHEIIKSWRVIADSYTDRFFVGETYDPVEVVMTYYGKNSDEFHFPFNFLLLSNDNWTGDGVNAAVSKWMDAMPEGAWPNWVLGNHDNPRIANKVGNYLARAMNVLLLTLPGTPTTYYGEEIFMTNVDVPPDERQDKYEDRDKERTPMQWTNETFAGFTNGSKPWLPVSKNYSTYNVRSESAINSSMLSLYKRLVTLITTNDAFRYAEYSPLMSDEDIFAYHRFHNSSKDEFIVVVNFSETNTTADLTAVEESFLEPKLELSSVDTDSDGISLNLQDIPLAGGEAVVIRGSSSGYQTGC
jgi:glycosidase